MNRLRPHGASQPRVGSCCARVGPGSLARRRLGVSAKAANDLDTASRKNGQKQKSPPRPEPGGPGGKGRAYLALRARPRWYLAPAFQASSIARRRSDT
jgi:hypothetical protein